MRITLIIVSILGLIFSSCNSGNIISLNEKDIPKILNAIASYDSIFLCNSKRRFIFEDSISVSIQENDQKFSLINNRGLKDCQYHKFVGQIKSSEIELFDAKVEISIFDKWRPKLGIFSVNVSKIQIKNSEELVEPYQITHIYTINQSNNEFVVVHVDDMN